MMFCGDVHVPQRVSHMDFVCPTMRSLKFSAHSHVPVCMSPSISRIHPVSMFTGLIN